MFIANNEKERPDKYEQWVKKQQEIETKREMDKKPIPITEVSKELQNGILEAFKFTVENINDYDGIIKFLSFEVEFFNLVMKARKQKTIQDLFKKNKSKLKNKRGKNKK